MRKWLKVAVFVWKNRQHLKKAFETTKDLAGKIKGIVTSDGDEKEEKDNGSA